MKEIQVWIITGPGGSRIDFIAGWLGCLPNFVNNWWGIDPLTGQSVGNMRALKRLDSDPNAELSHFFPEHVTFKKDAELTYAGSCHGYHLNTQISNLDFVKVFYIDTKKADPNKLAWEFFAKTYLSRSPLSEIPDLKRINQGVIKNTIDTNIKFNNSIVLDYTKLFVPGGSRYLCDVTNITVSDRYHAYYDTCLFWADTPMEIEAHGKTWRYVDYFNDASV